MLTYGRKLFAMRWAQLWLMVPWKYLIVLTGVGCKWVFNKKFRPDGIKKYKMRLKPNNSTKSKFLHLGLGHWKRQNHTWQNNIYYMFKQLMNIRIKVEQWKSIIQPSPKSYVKDLKLVFWWPLDTYKWKITLSLKLLFYRIRAGVNP